MHLFLAELLWKHGRRVRVGLTPGSRYSPQSLSLGSLCEPAPLASEAKARGQPARGSGAGRAVWRGSEMGAGALPHPGAQEGLVFPE